MASDGEYELVKPTHRLGGVVRLLADQITGHLWVRAWIGCGGVGESEGTVRAEVRAKGLG